MDQQLQQIEPGWGIYGSDGHKLAEVAGVHASGFVWATKGFFFPEDFYIPRRAITGIEPGRVHVNVTEAQLEHTGWDRAPAALRAEEAPYGELTDAGPTERGFGETTDTADPDQGESAAEQYFPPNAPEPDRDEPERRKR